MFQIKALKTKKKHFVMIHKCTFFKSDESLSPSIYTTSISLDLSFILNRNMEIMFCKRYKRITQQQ